MGRTFRRDDHHNSWGKSLRDKRQKGSSERYRDEYSETNSRSKNRGSKKFNVNNVSDYYEEDSY
jgi:hypothetical protein